MTPEKKHVRAEVMSCGLTDETHRQRIIDACLRKFRTARTAQISSLRDIHVEDLPSIAAEYLSEISANGDDEFISSSSLLQQDSSRPRPLIDEDDEILKLTRSESYEPLMFYILEAFEAELADIHDHEHQSFLHDAYVSNSYEEDVDVSIEYDCEEELICPLCRVRPMVIDPAIHSARCCCSSYNLSYGSYGDVHDFKRVLASIFERHLIMCSERIDMEAMPTITSSSTRMCMADDIDKDDDNMYMDDGNASQDQCLISDLLSFSVNSQHQIQATCKRCGFYEAVIC